MIYVEEHNNGEGQPNAAALVGNKDCYDQCNKEDV